MDTLHLTGKLKSAELSMLLSKIFFMSPSLMTVSRFSDHAILDANHRFIRFTGYSRDEIVGKTIPELNLLHQESYEHICRSLKTRGSLYNQEIEYRTKLGNIRAAVYSAELMEVRGEEELVFSVYHDITERRNAENAFKQSNMELVECTAKLEEANNALRVFSKRQSEDLKDLETKLQKNITELIIPYIRTLQNYNLDERGKSCLNFIESNLKDIVSPFLNNLSSDYKDLTPTEIQVAGMVRGGMTSKDIANLLSISVGTVDTHRNNIRKKLGLRQSKANLRSCLLSMA
jgi:PAS domain S-box-containing protein